MPADRGNATLIMQRGKTRPRPTRRRWRRLIRELGLLAVFAGIYEWIGAHLVQAGGAATSHALMIVAAERSLGLFHEQDIQQAFIHSDTITDAFNAYYGGTHFLVPAFVLGWLLFRHPGQYGRARTTLAALTGAAFACFWLFPVAPPRLLPARFGILDMLTVPDGSGHFETSLINTAGDKYASMPSLHVAWAVWCALALWPVVRPRILRLLVVAYPLLTVLVVVATGNHYFLDAVAGALLSVVSWIAVTRIGAWLSVRRGTRALARQESQGGLARPGSDDGVDVGDGVTPVLRAVGRVDRVAEGADDPDRHRAAERPVRAADPEPDLVGAAERGQLVGGPASGGRGHPCASRVTVLRRHRAAG
jgi:membrane-associated phospholipid phosphatase